MHYSTFLIQRSLAILVLIILRSIQILEYSHHLPSLPCHSPIPTTKIKSKEITPRGQNIRVSASSSILPMSIQDRFPLGWTDQISLQSKGLSTVFSNTTVQKHQFFGAQLSLQSNSYIHSHLTCQQSNAQNSSSLASTVCEVRNSRCSSQIQKMQRNQRLNCQHRWII